MGFNKDNTYETTSHANFTDKNPDFERHSGAHRNDRKSNLTHVYGASKHSYQTTNNSNFTEKDVAGSFKDKLLTKQRGDKLKQSNFSFGHFNNSNGANSKNLDISGQAQKFHSELAKQNQQAKQRGVELKKSNFELSKNTPDNGASTFKSMAQIQFDDEQMKGDNMAQLNQNNREVSNNLQRDLRSSHFKFGNNGGNSQS